jgi:hypothetical protein
MTTFFRLTLDQTRWADAGKARIRPLPPGSDVHEQVETLMREPWGLFSGTAVLDEHGTSSARVPVFEEISEEAAVHWLTWLLGHDLAYDDPKHVPVDSGVIAAGEGRAYIVWFTGED